MTKDTIETAGTPRPWVDNGDGWIASKTGEWLGCLDDSADATLAVKAVNGFDMFVKALKAAENHFGGPWVVLQDDAPDYAILEEIRAALKAGTTMNKSISTKGNTIIVKGTAKEFPCLAESAAIERWFEANVGQSIPVQSGGAWDGRKS